MVLDFSLFVLRPGFFVALARRFVLLESFWKDWYMRFCLPLTLLDLEPYCFRSWLRLALSIRSMSLWTG